MRRGGWVLMLVLVVLSAAGCGRGGNEVVLDAGDNGSAVTLAPGQVLVIHLASNPSTGYSWGRTDADTTVLVQEGEAAFEPGAGSEGKVGAGGTETLRFRAGQAGETTLELGYRRAWEKGIDPIETFQVQVTVRE